MRWGVEVVLFPDTTDRRVAEALRLGHAPHTPVGRIRWLAMQSGLDDGADYLFGNAWDATRPWSVVLQARHPTSQEPFSPELYGGPGDVQFPRDVLAPRALGRHLDHVGTLYPSQGDTAAMRPRGQSRALFGRQQDRGCGSHAPMIEVISHIEIKLFETHYTSGQPGLPGSNRHPGASDPHGGEIVPLRSHRSWGRERA